MGLTNMNKKEVVVILNQISEGSKTHLPHNINAGVTKSSPQNEAKETSSYIGIQIKTHCE